MSEFINDKKNAQLKALFASHKEVLFAYVFGSHARGDTGPSSDVDLACFLDSMKNSRKVSNLHVQLVTETGTVLHMDAVDMIILNESPLPLQFNIIYEGKLVFERDQSRRIDFEVKTMRLFFDRQYYYRYAMRKTVHSIAERGIL